ncbi:Myeloid-Associated Differentiation Marker-Like Protein 2 [Manis pentadactyla]|nr:Myeloid-Associated Differentiation Marker-Like Protein 2 [Manis pentadactyla]
MKSIMMDDLLNIDITLQKKLKDIETYIFAFKRYDSITSVKHQSNPRLCMLTEVKYKGCGECPDQVANYLAMVSELLKIIQDFGACISFGALVHDSH